MPPRLPVLVYVGPTLCAADVRACLPSAELRPPIRRGDLYRDRTLGHAAFVILDGVFFQEQAIPPREIADVLADGAFLAGASSMGALRAADCWPAGMRGYGAIYRLYRRGVLGSDDEVAVAFDPEAQRALSVPLVNVRHALWRAVRARKLERVLADRIAAAAAALFYADRTWPRILSQAGASAAVAHLRSELQACDLKRADAGHALRRVANTLRAQPALARGRRAGAAFVPSEVARERAHDALAGLDARRVKADVCTLLVASGRYLAPGWGLLSAAPRQVAEAVWRELMASDELDAALYRLRAWRRAQAEVRARRLAPTQLQVVAARAEIALAHGSDSWEALGSALEGHPLVASWIEAHATALAGIRRLREAGLQGSHDEHRSRRGAGSGRRRNAGRRNAGR